LTRTGCFEGIEPPMRQRRQTPREIIQPTS
jgi:hypothetical protein